MSDTPDGHRPQSAALLAAIVDSSSDAIVSKDLTGRVTSWNLAAERIFGFTSAQMVGQSIRRIIPPEYQDEEDTILERIASGHAVATFRTIRQRADGSRIPVSVTVSPVVDQAGKVIGASKIARDLSDNSELAQQLRDSDLRFRVLADNIPQLAWMADGHGYLYWYNQRWYDYTGASLQQMKGWGWAEALHPDHRLRVVESWNASLASGSEWEDLFPLRGVDGSYRWFLSRAKPVRDAAGAVVGWFGTNTDITEERAQQEQIRLLMREVNHRSKNMLAMIQSLARRTAPSENKDFVDRFEKRLQALAANQDLLMTRHWRFVDLRDLVRAQLYMVDDLFGSRIRLDGPSLMIRPAPAETIGLAIHELTTNAAKYGALSNETGTLEIRWHVEDEESDAPRLVVDWREHGGPPVRPPAREGFGTTVIRRMPRLSLAAEIEMDFAPEGLHWRLDAPADNILHGRLERSPPKAASIRSEEVGFGPVLLVEDEALVALDLMNDLTRHGYWVVGPATSLAAAEELLARHRPVCALIDVRLGERETTAALAAALSEQSIPFLVMTGFMAEELPAEFAGAPLLRKPVALPELLRRIEEIAPRALGKAGA